MNVEGPQGAAVKTWFNQIGLRRCPVCQDSRDGFFAEDVSVMIKTGTTAPSQPGVNPGVPVVPVICKSCGNTMIFHAGRLGLID